MLRARLGSCRTRKMTTSSSFTLTVDSCIHGFHVYCSVWDPVLGEVLKCEREPDNAHDNYAVSVLKRRQIVGHVPRAISRPCSVFIRNGGIIKCTVTGSHRYSADLEQGGMEIPCTYCFIGDESWLRKLSSLFRAKKCGATAVDGSKGCCTVVKLEEVECISSAHKNKTIVDLSANTSCTGETAEDDMWVKCDRQILYIANKEIIESGLELTDKHIQYAQYLLKKQFSTIGGLSSTLFQNQSRESLPNNSIQVIYCNARHHWIVVSNMECKKGVVNVYDSLFTFLDDETLGIIKNYFGDQSTKRKVQSNMAKVQKQKGTKDCGVYAVAFLTSLAYHHDPAEIQYCQDQLRSHLCDCFTKGKLVPFPLI